MTAIIIFGAILVWMVAMLSLGILTTFAGWQMMRLRSHGLAVTMSALALLPCHPAFLISLIFGIWALMVLNRPHIKAAFASNSGGRVFAPRSAQSVGVPEKDFVDHSPSTSQYRLAGDLLLVAAAFALLVAVGVAVWITFVGHASWTTIYTLWGMAGTLTAYALFIGGAVWLMRRRRARMAVLLIVTLAGVLVPGVLALNVLMEDVPQWPVLLPMWLALPICAWAAFLLLTSPYTPAAGDGPIDERASQRRLMIVGAAALAALCIGASVALYFVRQSSARDELPKAAREGDTPRVRQLLRWSDTPTKGEALEQAAIGGHADVIQMLVNAGAPLERQDNFGETPLADAVYQGNFEAAKVLIQAGADVHALDNGRQPILYWAIKSGQPAVVELLLQHGATSDVDARDAHGNSMLTVAGQVGNAKSVRLLIDAGASLETRDPRGETPLIESAYAGHASAVQALLDAGADIHARDNLGHTALAWAVARNQQAVIDLLLRQGANEEGMYHLWQGFNMATAGDVTSAVPLLRKAQEALKTQSGRRVLQLGNLRIITNDPAAFSQLALAECVARTGDEDGAGQLYRELAGRFGQRELALHAVIQLSDYANTTGEFDNDNFVRHDFTLKESALAKAVAQPLTPVQLNVVRTSASTRHHVGGGATRSENRASGTAKGIFASLGN